MSNKHQVFVEEYLRCWNASEAARRAGYSQKNADVVAARLLVDVGIAAAIKARLVDLQMGTDEILMRFTDQARGSMEDFVHPASASIDLTKAEKLDKLHLLKSLTRTVGEKSESVRIEMYDAQAALAHLARMRGMFVDKTALTDPTGTKEYAGLTDAERAGRLAEILDALRARRDRPATDDSPASPATD